MSLSEFAKSELERVDLEYDGMVKEAAQEIVDLFAKQGHSGGSAHITLGVIDKLLRFKPLTPLTGKDDEWMEVGEGEYQSKRCPTVFKDAERAWDIDLPQIGGAWQTITFPYVPGQDAFDRRAARIGGEPGNG